MIFAIAMDHTVFLLASAKEHYERREPEGRHRRLPGPSRARDPRRRCRHGRGDLYLRTG
ncbi:hypothetical protein [Nocardioides convexus]|uniref:hypothetical protein n=1 Tax=Nocardioides convexus TaxID=2712224 RepID=UPI0024185C59|nr:hypothetical protein [Nocardioides convexus]